MITTKTARIALLGFTAIAGCAAQAGNASERTATTRDAVINGTDSTTDQDVTVLVAVGTGGTCTGTMIAPDLVLTARHCVSNLDEQTGALTGDLTPSTLGIYTGARAMSKFNGRANPDAVGAKLFVLPVMNIENADIAVIQLSKKLTNPIAPVRLTGSAIAGESVTLVGWGITESGSPPTTRQQRTVSVVGVGADRQIESSANEFWVGEASCYGDSGGPMFDAKTKAVVGVVSRGGNGTQSQSHPERDCEGMNAVDIYSDVGMQNALIMKAFTAAGETPVAEQGGPTVDAGTSADAGGKGTGATSSSSSSSGDPATTTEPTDPAPPTVSAAPHAAAPDSGGCNSAGNGSGANGAAFGFVAAFALMATRKGRRA